jgi:hypothetical protein
MADQVDSPPYAMQPAARQAVLYRSPSHPEPYQLLMRDQSALRRRDRGDRCVVPIPSHDRPTKGQDPSFGRSDMDVVGHRPRPADETGVGRRALLRMGDGPMARRTE